MFGRAQDCLRHVSQRDLRRRAAHIRNDARVSTRPPLPRNVWVLGFVSLLMDLSSEIYHALLPAFVTSTLGLPVTALGAIDGVAEATANFAKLASGRLSDRSSGASRGSSPATASPRCPSRCSRSRPARRR